MEEKKEEYTISVNAAAKKYGIPQTTLSRWAAQGRIKVIRTKNPRSRVLVNEESVLLAAQHYHPYWRRRHFPLPQEAESLPPMRYCPYCGKTLDEPSQKSSI